MRLIIFYTSSPLFCCFVFVVYSFVHPMVVMLNFILPAFMQFFAAGDEGGACGADVIYDENMLAGKIGDGMFAAFLVMIGSEQAGIHASTFSCLCHLFLWV